MNLSHYFQHYQHFHLSDEKKTEIFQRIRQKRFEQSVMRQHFFSYKKLGYSVMAVALVLMTFGGVMIEKNISIDNLLFSSTEKNPSGVYADYIAEIIEFNGEYTIQNGDITLSSQYIHNGDIIQLKSGAEMLFTLNDHSQAKIIGPASFYLSMSKENNYKIYLTQGNFFKIFNETADNTIEIIADDITIQTKKHQPLDLQIAKEGKEILIKNNGGATKLTTKTSNVTKETQLEKEIVSIKNNDINIIKDAEQFTKLLAKYNISETLTLSAPSTVSSSEMLSGQLPISGSLALHTPDPIEIFEALPVFTETGTVQPSVITQQLKTDLGLENDLQIPNPAQNEVLKTTLNSFFLTNTMEKIYKALLGQDTFKLTEGSKDLADKLVTLAGAFGEEVNSSYELSEIRTVALALKEQLETKYYIAPSYLLQLEKIAHWCEYFQEIAQTFTGQPFTGQEVEHSAGDVDTQRNEFQANLPSALKL